MRQSYGLSILCRLLFHHSNGASILRLEVLKDILDADFVLRLHSLLPSKGRS